MIIRDSIISELDDVVNLRLKLWEYEKAIADFNIIIPDTVEIKNEITEFYENLDKKILVLENNWELIWLIYWMLEKTPSYLCTDDFEKTWYIESVYLDENYRWQGLWDKLIKSIIEWFNSNDVKFIQLWVLSSNIWAIEAYKRNWFEIFYTKMKRVW